MHVNVGEYLSDGLTTVSLEALVLCYIPGKILARMHMIYHIMSESSGSDCRIKAV